MITKELQGTRKINPSVNLKISGTRVVKTKQNKSLINPTLDKQDLGSPKAQPSHRVGFTAYRIKPYRPFL
ncbi:hypothetical protein OIU77_004780 [Salix suchowensis]|uniref:Uncharacterized protein n=1 Tax=Salix suchowensis TaxID=1278906 RepID=A0ABQ9AVT0_9ROSI|nr:hypothetical protein OIU77_004780 [Salix suchowensis]